MTILFQAKFLILTFITLIVSAASSNEILIHTEPNHYKLFRINEDSYRLSFKNYKRYWKQYKVDDILLRPVLEKVCQEYNFSSLNTYSYRGERIDNKDYNKGDRLGVYISCKKKIDPAELAKKLKQKEEVYSNNTQDDAFLGKEKIQSNKEVKYGDERFKSNKQQFNNTKIYEKVFETQIKKSEFYECHDPWHHHNNFGADMCEDINHKYSSECKGSGKGKRCDLNKIYFESFLNLKCQEKSYNEFTNYFLRTPKLNNELITLTYGCKGLNENAIKSKQAKPNNETKIKITTPLKSTSSLDYAKKECLELGFKNNTEKFGECVLQLSK